jgi:hypothetical protein
MIIPDAILGKVALEIYYQANQNSLQTTRAPVFQYSRLNRFGWNDVAVFVGWGG